MKVVFNKPPYTGNEDHHVLTAMRSEKMSGDGPFTLLCQKWFEQQLGCKKTLLTPSCTHALEMAAILIDIKPGDEVIMPSYTFVSTANPFVLRGANIVFVDIRPDTMNIDESLIESAITNKTKAIVPVHYAGVSCDMDAIMALAAKHNLYVVEDAAQGFDAFYNDQPVGTKGHMSAFSFHETKNITSGGEGGLLVINDPMFVQRAEIIREKGTNRSLFFRGMVDKYTWMDVGSSYLPSELQAAYLYSQLLDADLISQRRHSVWQKYHLAFAELELNGLLTRPVTPAGCQHNAHMYYIKVTDLDTRTALLSFLKEYDIGAVFHYVPLHSATAGQKFGRFHSADNYTTSDSERLIRLPLYFSITEEEIDHVIEKVKEFFS